jgi:hypothetical protein
MVFIHVINSVLVGFKWLSNFYVLGFIETSLELFCLWMLYR